MTDKRSLRLFHQIIALATDDRLNTVEFFQNFRGRLSPVKEGDKEKNGGRHGERGENGINIKSFDDLGNKENSYKKRTCCSRENRADTAEERHFF